MIPEAKANYLSREEEAALLKTLRRDASPTGKRDYALFLLLLRTGWPVKATRRLKWRDVACLDGGREDGTLEAFYGGPQPAPANRKLPEEVWRAVREYLEASGRLDRMGPEEYIFAPSRAPLMREAGCNAGDWAGERPLGHSRIHALLKQTARQSGLKAEAITWFTLRHTAAVRCTEAARAAGEDPTATMRRELGWGSPKTARRCWHQIRQKLRAPLILRRGRHPKIASHAPPVFKPGNQANLKHGLDARRLPEMAWLEAQGIHLEGSERETARLRIVLARVLTLSKRAKSIQEILWLSKAASRAARRLARMIEEKKAEETCGRRSRAQTNRQASEEW